MKRRLPHNCYLCGDPAVDGWHCAGHLWASPPSKRRDVNGRFLEHVTKEHAYWIERFTPEQVVELAEVLT